jgi:hypothetical protein
MSYLDLHHNLKIALYVVGGEENFRSIIKCAAQSAHREVLRRRFFDLLEC